MTTSKIEHPRVVSRAEWLVARKKLLTKEKELTRQRDALSAERRELPWVRMEKEYVFDAPDGKETLADRFGAKRILLVELAIQAVAVSLYLFTRELSSFYAVALVFGLAYGGVMPLYAIVVREYFGARSMGTVYGAVSLMSIVGMSLGPWAGGWLYDVFGSYFWLYVGSCGIGLGAVAIALTIRPPSGVPAAMLSPSRAA